MDMLTTDISSLGYKAVKEKVDKIDVNEVHNSEDLIKIIDILKADKRKNINSLGNKLQRAKDKIESEIKRVREMYNFDKSFGDFQVVAGVDEVGRGPLAGPVVVACALMPKTSMIEGVNDSKKISEKKREQLYEQITSEAISYGIGIIDQKEIDEINILQATKKGLTTAIKDMEAKLAKKPELEITKPDAILVDALTKIDTDGIPYKSIIHGDAISYSIACASIIAKVTRDRIMRQWDEIYPQYGFAKHKGYGTAAHIKAIKEYGPCTLHRASFIKNFI